MPQGRGHTPLQLRVERRLLRILRGRRCSFFGLTVQRPRLDQDEGIVGPDSCQFQGNISIHAFIRTDRSCFLTHGDDGGEDVHEGEELDSEHEGVEGVGEAQREGDAGGGRQRQEEALQGKIINKSLTINQLSGTFIMMIGINIHLVVVYQAHRPQSFQPWSKIKLVQGLKCKKNRKSRGLCSPPKCA